MSFSVLVLGVGDAFSARYYSSSLLLSAEGRHLLLDCPHPIRRMLKEAEPRLDIGDIDALYLSHLHADHLSGLESMAFYSHFLLKRPLRLLAHPEVAGPLWPQHFQVSMSTLLDPQTGAQRRLSFEDYFECQLLREQNSHQEGPFSIEIRRTQHHIPTFAIKLKAAGRCFAYSCDTSFDPELIRWLSEGDLIFHECNYGAHTPYERLAELPETLRARMRLIHYPDDLEISRGDLRIRPAIERQRYDLFTL